MADNWFKLDMDIFGNRKIKYLRRLPNGDSIVLFWVALLSEARRCNSGGKVFITESIPYTADVLAEEFKFEESIVKSALDAFSQLDMIFVNNGFVTIAGWEDHQNVEGLEKIREQNRLRKQKQREKQKLLQDASQDSHETVTQCHATEEEKERELELDLDLGIKRSKADFQSVVDLYHKICISYPKLRSLSEARKKAINARLKTYSMEEFQTVFENAEASSFLKGKNDRNWAANFDWLIADKNMAKVLEGNYADKGRRFGRKENLPGWFGNRELDEDETNAIQAMLAEDSDFQEEADQLRRELQESFGRSG